MERCLSGRWCNIGNVVYGNVPQVRILSSPPKPKNPAFYAGFFVFWRRGQRGRGSLRFACRLCRHTPRGSRLRETALSCPMVTKKLCYISLRPRILCGIFCVLAERTERKRFLAVRVPEGCLQPEETRRGAPACGKRRYPVSVVKKAKRISSPHKMRDFLYFGGGDRAEEVPCGSRA